MSTDLTGLRTRIARHTDAPAPLRAWARSGATADAATADDVYGWLLWCFDAAERSPDFYPYRDEDLDTAEAMALANPYRG